MSNGWIVRRIVMRTRSNAPERGEVTTQVVLILPVLLTTLFMVMHIAVASHVGHVAAAAAQSGARTASAADGDTSNVAVLNAVEQTITDLRGSLASIPTIVRSARRVVVTVDARVPALVPFLPDHVSRTAVVNVEQFLTEGQR